MDEVYLGSRTLQLDRQLLADGKRLHIGRRALSIISALARAKGEVVTKDELLDQVWSGLTVEENALPVHVVALRKALGPEAGRLETIHGIGYRLAVDEGAEQPTAAEAGARSVASPSQFLRRAPLLLTIIALAAAGLFALSLAKADKGGVDVEAPIFVARTVTGDASDKLVAANVHGAVMEALSKAGFALQNPEEDGSLPDNAGQVLRTTVTHNGGTYSTFVSLEHLPSDTTLWSRRFEAKNGDKQRMADQAAAATARTVYAMRETLQQPGLTYDAPTVALHLRGSEILRNRQFSNDSSASEVFRQVVEAYPRSASAHALLAVGLNVDLQSANPEQRGPLLAELKKEAETAITIRPSASGAAYDALAMAYGREHPDDLIGYEKHVLEGVRAAPDFAFIHMRECRFLSDIGLEFRALEYCRRAIALHPYAEPILHSFARVRAVTGDLNGAVQFLDRSAYLFPDHVYVRRTRFELAVFSGHAAAAEAILANPEDLPAEIEPEQAALWRDFLADYGRWSAARRNELSRRIEELTLSDKFASDWAVLTLAALDRPDAAFDLLGKLSEHGSAMTLSGQYLFQSTTAPLRRDPRFWQLVTRLGLVRYWQGTGHWPDFCGREMATSQCKAMATAAGKNDTP